MPLMSPFDVVQQGVKVQAPLAKFMVSAVVFLAGYAIIATWFTNPRDAIAAGFTMLMLIVLIIVLMALTRRSANEGMVQPAMFIGCSLPAVFVSVILATVSSFLFAWPTHFDQIFPRNPETLDIPALEVQQPQFEEFQQLTEYQASNSRSCTEKNVVRTFQYCATAEGSPLRAEILRYDGPREIWGRNGSSSIEINTPRSGCATITLRYSDYGRGPFGDCRGNRGIRAQCTLYVRRQNADDDSPP
jgi:hypothetical protein